MPLILAPELVVAVTALVLAAPAAHAAAPTCSDVSATVQNRADPDATGNRPVVKIVANCSDPDGTPLSYAENGDPPHGGYASYDPAGFNYSPNVGFSGTDSFRHVALGGGDVSTPRRSRSTCSPRRRSPRTTTTATGSSVTPTSARGARRGRRRRDTELRLAREWRGQVPDHRGARPARRWLPAGGRVRRLHARGAPDRQAPREALGPRLGPPRGVGDPAGSR